jgi:hypothetical protein
MVGSGQRRHVDSLTNDDSDGTEIEGRRSRGEQPDRSVQAAYEPGAPSDNTTLTSVLTALEGDGFGAQFVTRAGAKIECLVCGSVEPASRFIARRSRRLEGASDPADMVHVVATTCPVCNVGGTVVLSYGVNASPEDSDVSLALDVRGVEPFRGGSGS